MFKVLSSLPGTTRKSRKEKWENWTFFSTLYTEILNIKILKTKYLPVIEAFWPKKYMNKSLKNVGKKAIMYVYLKWQNKAG